MSAPANTEVGRGAPLLLVGGVLFLLIGGALFLCSLMALLMCGPRELHAEKDRAVATLLGSGILAMVISDVLRSEGYRRSFPRA
jgi:hypothetical protein